ncbi:hypothetical protein M153_8910001454 [Pseudoloma neurophilia]|uniref:Uncharacterized protein n=1 Tax=Pseudoloma neurophilia TaxID=146866 RepID=A0A0R0M1Z7_9MICR|nr:hypothetical protein M153_8910001454 [Pseudoloma neurophilia]
MAEVLEDIFEIEDTKDCGVDLTTDMIFDFSHEDVQRYNSREIEELKAEILKVEKMLANKK